MIAERVRDDERDALHKAVGWMWREIDNRDRDAEEAFPRDRVRLRAACEAPLRHRRV
jgi:3-methyladenine DNA glycosylase AlkD